jgi:predicted ABC-type ATPase
MTNVAPRIVILAGPNGAGKSTSAGRLLLGPLAVSEFVNADTIAAGLSAFSPDTVAFEAGRVMLTRLRELAKAKASFAFETTLATRSYVPWLTSLQARNYVVELVFLWLPSPEMAIRRVADRVAAGGHDVPTQTIRRRYAAGLRNLRSLYLPLADAWTVIDSTDACDPAVIAMGRKESASHVFREPIWRAIINPQGD